MIVTGDYTLSSTVVTFRPPLPNSPPSSSRPTECVQFETVKDRIVENDELMVFRAQSMNSLDRFLNNTFALTIFDDDGI